MTRFLFLVAINLFLLLNLGNKSSVQCQTNFYNPPFTVNPFNIQETLAFFNLRNLSLPQTLFNFGQSFDVNSFFKNLFVNYIKENLSRRLSNVSSPCLRQIFNISDGLANQQIWALQVLDAFGKPTSGILEGSLRWVGEYDECVGITESSVRFQGKYCSLSKPLDYLDGNAIESSLASNFLYGICVPYVCSDEDIVELINFVVENIPENITKSSNLPIQIGKIKPNYVNCQVEKTFDTKAIVAIVIMSIIVFVVVVATVYDLCSMIFKTRTPPTAPSTEIEATEATTSVAANAPKQQEKRESTAIGVLRSFSFYTNAKKLFHVAQSDDQLQCLHAIRFLTFAWVILGHTFSYSAGSVSNLIVQFNWLKRFSFLFVSNGFFAVDTFFVLSGLLTCYIFVKEITKMGRKITLKFMLKYYIHRFWRLSPPYFILLMFQATLTKYLGYGPFFPKEGFEADMCKTDWWKNLVYINNIVKPTSQCFAVTWYLANDMQFHWVAPILLIPFALRKIRIGILLSIAMIVASILSIGLLLNANPGSEMGIFGTNFLAFMVKVYNPPWTRISPFVVGVILGYIIYVQKSKIIDINKFKLIKVINVIAWIFALFLCSIVISGLYSDFQGKPASREAHIVYQSFSRLAWAIGVSIIILSCVTGNAGFVNKILSWSIWVPLSRLTYSAYLSHHIILMYHYLTLKHPVYMDEQLLGYFYIGHLVLSYVVAFFVSLCFEVPFIGLEKFIFGVRKRN